MAHSKSWPLFQPEVIFEHGEYRYLGEDYSFCWRCKQVGVQVWLDTSFRVYHLGDYAYGWEESAGNYVERYRNLEYQIRQSETGPS